MRKLLFTSFLTLVLACSAHAKSLDERLASTPENLFERGSYETLKAVETALQSRYQYGLGESNSFLPVLRLPLPGGNNPRAKEASADTLSNIMRQLLTDLAKARTTLEKARAEGADAYILNPNDLWLDANANGIRNKGEGVVELLTPALLGPRARRELEKNGTPELPEIRFDAADLDWLLAYTHLLSGIGNAYLAYDPAPVWEELAAQRATLSDAPVLKPYYDRAALRLELDALSPQAAEAKIASDAAVAAQSEVRQRQIDLRARQKDLSADTSADAQAELAKITQELAQLQIAQKVARDELNRHRRARRAFQAEIRAIKQQLEGGRLEDTAERYMPQIDMTYVLLQSLAQEPAPARVRAAFTHWRAMIAENRAFWAALEAETDNDREWIPNPRQTAAFPIEVDSETAQAWQDILKDAEALLDGRLLVPHPLLPKGYGLSLPRFEADPGSLELLPTAHGSGLYQYAAYGDAMTALNWRRFARLAGGNAGGFALWFN